jgi:hypothetical protein
VENVEFLRFMNQKLLTNKCAVVVPKSEGQLLLNQSKNEFNK